MKLKNLLNKKFYKAIIFIYDSFFNSFRNNSFSQEGEDLVLKRIFENKKQGFYIDVGAHHPKRFSNTFLFYKLGWTGINIEPNPKVINLFNKKRPRDINIKAAISDKEETFSYYMFTESALNTFSAERKNTLIQNNSSQLLKKIDVHSTTLKNILDIHLKSNTIIDFLSIDTEGLDLQVLKSNNWEKYRPTIVLVEDANFNLQQPALSDIFNFLFNVNYRLVAKTFKTLIFEKII
jgi:FkbM family methyltransferase